MNSFKGLALVVKLDLQPSTEVLEKQMLLESVEHYRATPCDKQMRKTSLYLRRVQYSFSQTGKGRHT